MCVLFIAFKSHPKHPLIVLANRDEFYDRPTAPAERWKDHPNVTAGRDLAGGGTWLGIADRGRFAAVTNYRDPSRPVGTISRGRLVSGFLTGNADPDDYMQRIAESAKEYSGFNLIVGTADELFYFSNAAAAAPQRLSPGVYGLSNHLLDTPWPKVSNGLAAFERLVSDDDFSKKSGFDLLTDDTLAADIDLPNTGVGIEKERILSPIFIRTSIYGTRSSTIVIANQGGHMELEERVFV